VRLLPSYGSQLQLSSHRLPEQQYSLPVHIRGQRCQHVRLHQLPYHNVHHLPSSDAELLHLSAVQREQEAVGIIMLCLFAAGV